MSKAFYPTLILVFLLKGGKAFYLKSLEREADKKSLTKSGTGGCPIKVPNFCGTLGWGWANFRGPAFPSLASPMAPGPAGAAPPAGPGEGPKKNHEGPAQFRARGRLGPGCGPPARIF